MRYFFLKALNGSPPCFGAPSSMNPGTEERGGLGWVQSLHLTLHWPKTKVWPLTDSCLCCHGSIRTPNWPRDQSVWPLADPSRGPRAQRIIKWPVWECDTCYGPHACSLHHNRRFHILMKALTFTLSFPSRGSFIYWHVRTFQTPRTERTDKRVEGVKAEREQDRRSAGQRS